MPDDGASHSSHRRLLTPVRRNKPVRRHGHAHDEEESADKDRWLISYADFITLLFAFFVVMYALSSINEGKYKTLSNSLIDAFGAPLPAVREPLPLPSPTHAPVLPAPRPRNTEAVRREREQMTGIALDIQQVLAPLVSEGKVRVTQTPRGVNVEINASVLFAPGEAKLADDTSQALRAIAAVLKSDTHAIQVEGHTDSVPIRTVLFASNWELSAVRASSVVRLFADNGIAEERLTAVGYGATRPVSPNETGEGRMRNRRVAVMILSNLPEVVTEVPLETPVK
jgi:chemotaxis protein MotB